MGAPQERRGSKPRAIRGYCMEEAALNCVSESRSDLEEQMWGGVQGSMEAPLDGGSSPGRRTA